MIFRILLSVLILTLPLSCGKNTRSPVKNLRFAIIGNTCPESPFSGFDREIDLLVTEINRANPVFLIHTGNIVHGGKSWMGIKEIDLKRQFGEFISSMKKLSPTLYTVPGSLDHLDGERYTYRKYTGRKNYYSFNYGALHFVVLDSKEGSDIVDKAQMEWLENDLEKYRDTQGVIIFIHHPLFMAKGKRMVLKRGEKLHGILKFYPVKAVFSGNLERYYHVKNGGVEYYITGTRRLHKKGWSRNRVHYYIVDFDGQSLKVEEKELDL
jgi:3',5'-cyclic AMP phosphodiesterase CpdA